MSIFSLTRRVILSGAAAAVAAIGLSSTASAAGHISFEGETVTIVSFGAPGSPPDVWYRSLAPYLKRHLPGNPDIDFINKPGAGSMISANYTAQAVKPDGFTVGTFNAIAMTKAAKGDPSAKFNLREMQILGANQLTRVIPVKLDGVSNIDELIARDGELIIGMESDATPYFSSFFKLAGIDGRIISSYQRFPDTLQAFRSGEVDAMPMSNIEWLTFGPDLSQNGVEAIWQFGYIKDGEVTAVEKPDVPTGHDVIRRINPDAVGGDDWNEMLVAVAGQSVSNEIWAPAGTPPEYAAVWAQAFFDAVNDPEFQAEHEKAYGIPASWTDAATARAIVDSVLEVYGN